MSKSLQFSPSPFLGCSLQLIKKKKETTCKHEGDNFFQDLFI
jgi:hypothetical protein